MDGAAREMLALRRVHEFDVVILGGGVAGLSLALHLAQSGGARVAVVDRDALPGDASRLKLGESVSEGAAWYLGIRLGQRELLERQHLRKFGLRFFLGTGDFDSRIEVGPIASGRFDEGVGIRTYQFHRGRLEGGLARAAMDAGVVLMGDREVLDVHVGQPHRVSLAEGDSLEAAWVIDATGGRGELSGDFPARQTYPHDTHVAHGWLDGVVDPSSWSGDVAYAERVADGLRGLSTGHLVGPGYFIWLIQLPGELTSVGVVARRAETIEGADSATGLGEWLKREVPELARDVERLGWKVEPRRASISAYATQQVVSPRRLGVTGQAAVYLDPLYSSGLDLCAIANEALVASVLEDLGGEDFAAHAEARNRAFASMAGNLIPVYELAYAQLADPSVGRAKVFWDLSVYAGFIAPLIASGEFARTRPLHAVRDIAVKVHRVNRAVQTLFAEWAAADRGKGPRPRFCDLGDASPFRACFDRLRPTHTTEELRGLLERNLEDLERQAMVSLLSARSDLGIAHPRSWIDPGELPLRPGADAGHPEGRPRRAREIDDSVLAGVRALGFEPPSA